MKYSTQFVADFAVRTRRNLSRIQQAKDEGETVYEVTQLWNSLLGLVVMPKEREITLIPDTLLIDLREAG